MKVKTTNALMKYLRENKKININGSKHKIFLKNYGYYHGYKGYRFIKSSQNKINLENFDILISLIEFDSKLKNLLYSKVMDIETISKNIVLQIIIEKYRTDQFNEIYEIGLTDYKDSSNSTKNNKIKSRLNLRNNIYSSLSHNYSNENPIVKHFYLKDENVPIWGIFEILTLGIFADLIRCLELDARKQISKEIGTFCTIDTNARFPEKIIYLIKSLRNSIAHNDIIFDVRFKDGKTDQNLCRFLEAMTGCKEIKFNSITDYIILIMFLLKNFDVSKKELKKFLNEYEQLIEDFRKKVPIQIYNQIIFTNVKNQINILNNYIKT